MKLLTSEIYADHRGVFLEGYREDDLQELIGVPRFVQGNVSISKRGVLRGMHYQVVAPQGKLMRTVHGRTMNAVVDMREGSSTLGRQTHTVLQGPDVALWVPPGFANGFLALEDDTVVAYECSTYYRVGSDRGVNPFGLFVSGSSGHENIFWYSLDYIQSEKDAALPNLPVAPLVPETEWRT